MRVEREVFFSTILFVKFILHIIWTVDPNCGRTLESLGLLFKNPNSSFCTPDQWFVKHGLRASSSSITGERVRDASSQALPQDLLNQKLWGGAPAQRAV